MSDESVVERMRELSAQYPRYGYRRIRIFLGRDGGLYLERAIQRVQAAEYDPVSGAHADDKARN
jgi:hypothetical protein